MVYVFDFIVVFCLGFGDIKEVWRVVSNLNYNNFFFFEKKSIL